jgi:hypothetical protein
MSEKSVVLTVSPFLHSYKEWEINNLKDLFIHLMYPGGNSTVNHEINFLDITVPVVLIVFTALFFGKLLFTQFKELEYSLQKASIFFSVGIAIYVINQFVFTGIRYALVAYPLMITALATFSFTRMLKWRIVVTVSTLLLLSF